MKDRVAGAPGQYKATVTGAELNKLQNGEPFAITLQRDDKPEVEGTPYSKAAVLPDHVARKVCPIKGDPTPADAFDALASEVGNKAEVFGFKLPVPTYNAKTGRYDYQFTLGDYPQMQGRTVTVRTYMYGDMAISGDAFMFAGCTNENANIEQNPESGICEFTDTLPSAEDDEFVDELSFTVPFCENPYLEKPMIFEARGSVWNELKHLEGTTGSGGNYFAPANAVVDQSLEEEWGGGCIYNNNLPCQFYAWKWKKFIDGTFTLLGLLSCVGIFASEEPQVELYWDTASEEYPEETDLPFDVYEMEVSHYWEGLSGTDIPVEIDLVVENLGEYGGAPAWLTIDAYATPETYERLRAEGMDDIYGNIYVSITGKWRVDE